MTAAAAADVFGKVSIRLIPFMLLLYVVAYLDRINVSFAALQMNRELGFNEAVFGLGAGVFFIGYFLFGIPSNLMVERFGAKRWIAFIMVVWGLVSLSMALIQDEMSFYVLRFLLGVAEAGFFPGMILYLTYWFPKKKIGLAVARFMTAIPAAGVLGGLVAACVPAMNGVCGLSGWKWLFLLTGSLPVLLGFIAYWYLTDKPEHADWLTAQERSCLLEQLEADKISQATDQSCNSVKGMRSGRVWLLAGIYFLLALGMYGFQLWLPQIIQATGVTDDSTTALLSTIPAIFQAAGMLVIAGHSDSTGERRGHVAAAAAVAAISLALSGFCPTPVLAMLALSFAAFGIWGTVGPFWALPTASLPPAAAAGGIALINSVGNLGGFAGPFIIGLVKKQSGSFTFALLAVACSLFLAAVLAITVKPASKTASQ